MFNKLFIIVLLSMPMVAFSQECNLVIDGIVIDEGTGEHLEDVNIIISETGNGVYTDSVGQFNLNGLCSGEYHLVLSHIGCETQQIFLSLTADTSLVLVMEHTINTLHDVEVTGKITPKTTQNTETIREQTITDGGSERLSDLLESIAGVSTLRNGNGISKPVIHGLYGNRLTILNNGISQSGQQWGNDHSPEIDPLVANKIRVVKGSTSLEYMGANLGSVVLVEPQKIQREPHLHGQANYYFESNGLSNGLNLQLGQYKSKMGWKVNGTLKKVGDRKTPDYFLTNSGSTEANISVQLTRSFSEKWNTELYFSSFNTTLGVLRGSHIGNITDLESAFDRSIPFFTEDKFSYDIEAPKQKVSHHLLKLHSKNFINETEWFDFVLAAQLNNRREFDVRRSGRSEIPALSLEQYTGFAEVKYNKEYQKDLKLRVGGQFNITDNTNNPETGILPLIPDYLSFETGAFVILSKRKNRSFFELGGRYDNVIQNVAAISTTDVREILRFNNTFHNFSAFGGWTLAVDDNFTLSYNLGYANRNPAINELYSAGLHQGVSGIEEGNPNLKVEKSIKSTFGVAVGAGTKFSFESLFYHQRIDDYIYLNPQDQLRLTIRGAFPVFIYEQTDARIYGLDLNTQWQISKTIDLNASYSYIKGDDRSNDLPLINIPSNNFNGALSFTLPQTHSLGNNELSNIELSANVRHVFFQDDILEEQDFKLPPSAYTLVGASVSADVQLGKNRLRVVGKIDNLLNEVYRDYLNRQRYFADDLGTNFTLAVNFKF